MLQSSFWHDLLMQIEQLGSDALEWNEYKEFLDAVEKIASRKKLNLSEAIRLLLETEQTRDIIVYFQDADQLHEIDNWDAENSGIEEQSDLIEQVIQLQEKMVGLHDLLSAPIKEQGKFRAKIEEIGHQIINAYDNLNPHLTRYISLPQEEWNDEVESGQSFPMLDDVKEYSVIPHESPVELVESPVEFTGELGADPEDWIKFAWESFARDDLTGTYWIASAIQHHFPDYLPAALNPSLLLILQNAQWISSPSDPLVFDLINLVEKYQPSGKDSAEDLLAFAVGIIGSLLIPRSMTNWLREVPNLPSSRNLIRILHEFTSYNYVIPHGYLREKAKMERLENEIYQLRNQAKKWRDEIMEDFTMSYFRATRVWREFCKRDGKIYQFVSLVITDDRTLVDEAQQMLDYWHRKANVDREVDNLDRILAGTNMRPIQGAALAQIFRSVQQACMLVEKWLQLVRLIKQFENEFHPTSNQFVQKLQVGIQQNLARLEEELNQLFLLENAPIKINAAVRQVYHALAIFCEVLEIPFQSPIPLGFATKWMTKDTDICEVALARRLLYIPEISAYLDDEFGLLLEHLDFTVSYLYRFQTRSLQSAFKEWLAKEDYRFAEVLLGAMEVLFPPEIVESNRQEYLRSRSVSVENLLSQIDELLMRLERNFVDRVIGDIERSDYQNKIDQIKLMLKHVLNFPVKRQEVMHILEELDAKRHLRQVQLREQYDSLINDLHKYATPHLGKMIEQKLSQTLQNYDIGLADEYSNWIRTRQWGLFEQSYDYEVEEGGLEDFQQMEPLIYNVYRRKKFDEILTALQTGQNIGIHDRDQNYTLEFRRMSQRGEAISFMTAVGMLRRSGVEPHTTKFYNDLEVIFKYLGFEPSAQYPLGYMRTMKSGTDWVYLEVKMSSSYELFQHIPQLGTHTRNKYHVLCIWKNLSSEMIHAHISNLTLSAQAVLVIYVGRLSAQDRENLARTSRRNQQTIAVLDETLMLYLAMKRRKRAPLALFLECALPFSRVNPYSYTPRDVPAEMFFGRINEKNTVLRKNTIVFGGRQLGKSALLLQVQTEFHQPYQNQYAIYQDIRDIGTTTSPNLDILWQIIHRHLVNLQSDGLPYHNTSEDPKRIQDAISDLIISNRNLQLLLLLDEADNFLREDAKNRFPTVDLLNRIITQGRERFRVVFAGLNNVQRSTGIPNSPLTQYERVPIGPLDAKSAHSLIKAPMRTLGFFFQDDETIVRILSYTNYHPALIQLFCHALLEKLYDQLSNINSNQKYPYKITRRDVEEVYLQAKVRDLISERFNLTLQLDQRYEAITWALIEEQTKDEGFRRTYSPSEVLVMVRYWWADGFKSMDVEAMKTLLGEMEVLGVLTRDLSGQNYQIRSPNLVQLLGSMQVIETKLLELANKKLEDEFDANNYHRWWRRKDTVYYSPLTFQQERLLNPSQNSVNIVHATKVLGYDVLPSILKHFLFEKQHGYQGARVSDIEVNVRTKEDFIETFHKKIVKSPHERWIFYLEPHFSWSSNSILHGVEAAHSAVMELSKDKFECQIFFFMNSNRTYDWLKIPLHDRLRLEEQIGAVAYVKPWSQIGIRKRLEEQERNASDEICQIVHDLTGGFHWLVERIFEVAPAQEANLSNVARIVYDELGCGENLAQEFWKVLEIEDFPIALRIMKFIHQYEWIERDLWTPSQIASELNLNDEKTVLLNMWYLENMSFLCVDDNNIRVSKPIAQIMNFH